MTTAAQPSERSSVADSLRHTPASTYRFQFHAGFTFRDAARLVPYLKTLGISHVYASPYCCATPGSKHGYDVIDPTRLNPEIGSEEDYNAFFAALRDNGMFHIVDIVPNHMGVGTNENVWLNDVLKNGRESKYADFFDINWDSPVREEMRGKVMLPLLGKPLGEVIEAGELKLVEENGEFKIAYYSRKFPISPKSYAAARELVKMPEGAERNAKLLALIDAQAFRLAYWKAAPDEINYRRFFDVPDLMALKMEREEVFAATHERALRWVAEGKIQGLRVDHPDGLLDPKQYFDRLQKYFVAACEKAGTQKSANAVAEPVCDDRPLYVVAEKILAADEDLPREWQVAGTTGYEFITAVNGLLVDRANEEAVTRVYREFTGETRPFDEIALETKKFMLAKSFAGDLEVLARMLDRIAQKFATTRDLTFNQLREAIGEIVVSFGVYRTYITPDSVSETDVQRITAAVEKALARNRDVEPRAYRFVQNALLRQGEIAHDADARNLATTFAGKFQQLTSPVTAKGIEDTAFYRYFRLTSLNEVGGDPGRFGNAPDDVHAFFQARQRSWPTSLSPLSTHDTKRSEDVRARISVLSEIPDDWAAAVREWSAMNRQLRQKPDDAPDANTEYLLYQTLIGAWPVGHDGSNTAEHKEFVERIQAYTLKAIREGKDLSSWTNPNTKLEEAMASFIARVLDPKESRGFLESFLKLQKRVERHGFWNSLAQTVLKIAAPGVPDTYQGTELWDLSLVDPDNRRPVDYAKRRELTKKLNEPLDSRDVWNAIKSGAAKLSIQVRALEARLASPELFTTGDYLPLKAEGPKANHVFAFARRHGDRQAIAIVTRLTTSLCQSDQWNADAFAETWLLLPQGFDGEWRNVFTGETRTLTASTQPQQLLATLPVALLVRG